MVQIAWRFSYNGLLGYLADQHDLGCAVGLPCDRQGHARCISQSQYGECRQALGLRPYLLSQNTDSREVMSRTEQPYHVGAAAQAGEGAELEHLHIIGCTAVQQLVA